jgi:hypothetical protein
VLAANSAKTIGQTRLVDFSTVFRQTYIENAIRTAAGAAGTGDYTFTQRASTAGALNVQLAERKSNGKYANVALGMFSFTINYRVNAAANTITLRHLETTF